MITQLDSDSDPARLARAAVEAVAHQVCDVVEIIDADSAVPAGEHPRRRRPDRLAAGDADPGRSARPTGGGGRPARGVRARCRRPGPPPDRWRAAPRSTGGSSCPRSTTATRVRSPGPLARAGAWLRRPAILSRVRRTDQGRRVESRAREETTVRCAAGWCDPRLRRRPGAADDQDRAPLPRAELRQSEIAGILHISQAKVSRLLKRAGERRHRPHGGGRLARACTPIWSRRWRSGTDCWRRWWPTSTGTRRRSGRLGLRRGQLSGGDPVRRRADRCVVVESDPAVGGRPAPSAADLGRGRGRPAGGRCGRGFRPGPGEPAA